MNTKKIFGIALISILSSTYFAFASKDKNLKYGQRDKEVTELQDFLIDKGFLKTPPSTFFGLLTLKAVKMYQTSIGVSSTGFVGILTREKINNEIATEVASSNEAEIKETTTTVITPPAPTEIIKGTKACQSGKVISKNEDCTKTCSDGEIIVENLTCRGKAQPSINNQVQSPQSTVRTNTSLQLSITLGQVNLTVNSAHLEWDTNLPSNSKVFVTQSGVTKIVESSSGYSTHHIADITSLTSGTQYLYTVEAISGNQSQKLTSSFNTPIYHAKRNISVYFSLDGITQNTNTTNDWCHLNLNENSLPDGGIPTYSADQSNWPLIPRPYFASLNFTSGILYNPSLDGLYLKSVKVRNTGTADLSKIELGATNLSAVSITNATAEFSTSQPLLLTSNVDFTFNPNLMAIGETLGLSIVEIKLGSNNSTDEINLMDTFPLESKGIRLAIKCQRQ